MEHVITLDKDTHTYHVDGVETPSVSHKVGKVLKTFDGIPEWLLDKIRAKSVKGRTVHEMIRIDLTSKLDVSTIDDSLKGWWESYVQFKNDAHLKCELCEYMAFDEESNTAMTIDYYGYSFLKSSLLDWKTGGIYKSYKPQLGYYLKWLLSHYKTVGLVGCVQLNEKGKKGKLIEYDPIEIIKDSEAIDRVYKMLNAKGL